MNGSRLTVRSGSEGPEHDPYHYDEYTLERGSGAKTTMHVGLSVWLRHNSLNMIEDNEKAVFAKWLELTGLRSLHDVERIRSRIQRARYRAHGVRCSNKNLIDQSGYPGESFVCCAKCGAVLDYHFDIGAVQ